MPRREPTRSRARVPGDGADGGDARRDVPERARRPEPAPRRAPRPVAEPEPAPDADGPWSVELHTERTGLLAYRYRRLLLPRDAPGARAPEPLPEPVHDEDQDPAPRPPAPVRQRGRSIDAAQAARPWGKPPAP